ncbi:MAG: cupin domain-containing protein [Alphaproteobacteria bacterium]
MENSTVSADEVGEIRLGTKLRHARMVRGLLLKDVATKAGCSESLLSKIENGHANPSVQMLHRIANVLGANFNALFASDDLDSGIVARAGERPEIDTDQLRKGRGIAFERLIPYAPGHLLQGNIHVIAPGGESEGLIDHVGEEVGYVLEGELELFVGDKEFRLSVGDSFHFNSDTPHRYRNPGKVTTRVIWVNSPPTF